MRMLIDALAFAFRLALEIEEGNEAPMDFLPADGGGDLQYVVPRPSVGRDLPWSLTRQAL